MIRPLSTLVEARLLKRLRAPTLFDGVTTAEDRRERLRSHLHAQSLAQTVAGRAAGGGSETWAAVFERLHGVPL